VAPVGMHVIPIYHTQTACRSQPWMSCLYCLTPYTRQCARSSKPYNARNLSSQPKRVLSAYVPRSTAALCKGRSKGQHYVVLCAPRLLRMPCSMLLAGVRPSPSPSAIVNNRCNPISCSNATSRTFRVMWHVSRLLIGRDETYICVCM